MNESTTKVDIGGHNALAGVGVVIWILGSLFGGLPALAGYIVLLVALHGISSKLKIGAFRKALIAMILSTIGFLIFFFVFGFSLLSAFSGSSKVSGTSFILSAVIFYSTIVYGAYLFKKAFDEIADKTKHTLLKTAGTFMFWGAVLLIVFIGAFVYLIGLIILAVAFFTNPKEVEVA